MTFEHGRPVERTETADEYGRRENCFRDHRRHPFTFQSYTAGLQSTKDKTEKDGLVAQPGVRTGVLPNPQLSGDVFDQDLHHQRNLEKLLQDIPPAFPLPSIRSALVKELLLPVDELDLGSSPEKDVQEHLHLVWAKRYSNPFEQWLPLANTRSERDEGIGFPPSLDRLWALLHREIDCDRPIMSDTAAGLVRDLNKSLTASEYRDVLRQQTSCDAYQYSYLEPISPPLSPVSDDAVPFIPDGDVAVIDLVSEPSSPDGAAIDAIQHGVDSEPIVSCTFMTPPPTGELPQFLKTRHTIMEEVREDVPVVIGSFDVPNHENIFENICLPLVGDLDDDASNLLEERGHFEDAFMTLLEDRRYYADKLVNQERLDPADSISRIPVPLLDFDIQPPEWTIQRLAAKSHFVSLKKSMPSVFGVPTVSRDALSEMSLRWAVFPLGKGQPMPKDALEVPDGTSTEYLWQDPAPRLSSIDFVSIKPELDVLCIPEDEEVEEACLVEDVAEVAPSPAVDWQHESPDRTNSAEKSSLSYFQDGGCPDLNRPLRRKFDEEPARLLPMSCDTSATSILLHNFMELRGIKRPRLHTGSAAVGRPMDGLPSKTNHEAHTRNDHQELPPTRVEETAPAPHFEIPARQASFLISVHLARPILRRLENAWAPENLIDIDYSRHNAVAGAPGAGQPKEVISPLSFEADISLSPSTAIIITSLLKVKQRPLPGSASQAPLRERVHKVSQRYETLIVLVSGPQPDGEFRGVLAPSDVAAYADFLTFAVALDGDVNVHLVPGAEDTMASWVLAFMSRHCRQSEALKRFLSPEETPWEIFLRQAGMNVVAAKVLSKTLFEQAGAYGLAAFLVMPVQERIARYGQLLGGEKVLRLTAKALDRKWG